MPVDTYSVKASEETQERIKTLINESGLNGKDFFVNLISMYEIQRAKEITPILTADLEELETLTRRINSIFANASERINTLQKESTEERERQAETDKTTIELLQQHIKSLEQDRLDDESRIKLFIEDREQAERQSETLQTRIKELDETINDKAALIEEYKQKNDDLNTIVSEYKAAAAENKNLIETVNNLKQVNESLQRKTDELNKEQQKLTEIHKSELETQKNKLTLQKDTELLELKQELQIKLDDKQEKYSAVISEYENRVRELLMKTEQNKPETPKTPTAKKASTRGKKESGPAEQMSI